MKNKTKEPSPTLTKERHRFNDSILVFRLCWEKLIWREIEKRIPFNHKKKIEKKLEIIKISIIGSPRNYIKSRLRILNIKHIYNLFIINHTIYLFTSVE